MKKQLIIVRHGETEYNRLNIVQGSGVDMGLNDTGKHQAQLFYNQYKNYPFQHVYISALKRTYQSVERFILSGIPHTVIPELNEISWGEFEGKQQTAEQKTLYWNAVQAWSRGDLDVKIPGGESPIELQNRQRLALSQILSSPHEHILVCMHGRAMKSFLCLLLDQPLTRMEDFQHSNLCVYHLVFENNKFSLQVENSTSHLMS